MESIAYRDTDIGADTGRERERERVTIAIPWAVPFLEFFSVNSTIQSLVSYLLLACGAIPFVDRRFFCILKILVRYQKVTVYEPK